MKEVIDRYELVEGTRIQTAADLDIVSSQQSHRRPVLLLENLPLQGRAQQQEVVVCTEQESNGITEEKHKHSGIVEDKRNEGRKGGRTHRI